MEHKNERAADWSSATLPPMNSSGLANGPVVDTDSNRKPNVSQVVIFCIDRKVSVMGRWALRYAERFGWPIFPLRPRTKKPFEYIGVYHATTDTDQIRDWWQRWPQANIGLHCGGGGVMALDADKYKDTYAGDALLTKEDEQTPTSLTGRGGTHLLYAMPGGLRLGNATGGLPAGIDIRGHGGYIVLPPSMHPNGRPYQWENEYGPHEIALLSLPSALHNLLARYTISDKIETAHPARIRQAVALVERVLTVLDIPATGPVAYMESGRRWTLGVCPFNPPADPHPADRGPFVIVFPDGRIVAGCQHNRCRQEIERSELSGWRWLRQRADLGGGAWHDAAVDALVASLKEVAA